MKPLHVSDLEIAFPADIKKLMPFDDPEWKKYRQSFAHAENSWGFKLFNEWFYKGLSKLELKAKDGVDKDAALRHIRAIMGSFAPKHEDKTAACALLFEKWFEKAEWEVKK